MEESGCLSDLSTGAQARYLGPCLLTFSSLVFDSCRMKFFRYAYLKRRRLRIRPPSKPD